MRFDIVYFLAAAPAILIALSLHEFGHAAMATKMGDPTPRLQGRLTLNPMAHLDPMGTIFIIITLLMGFGFGWGKPVQTNPSYYTNYRLGRILVAIAGPAMNLCQAMFGVGIAYIMFMAGLSLGAYLQNFLLAYIMINIVLMVFNLLPIPPLDGGHVLEMMLPWEKQRQFQQFAQYGLLVLLALMWFGVLGFIMNIFFKGLFWALQAGFGPAFVDYLTGRMG